MGFWDALNEKKEKIKHDLAAKQEEAREKRIQAANVESTRSALAAQKLGEERKALAEANKYKVEEEKNRKELFALRHPLIHNVLEKAKERQKEASHESNSLFSAGNQSFAVKAIKGERQGSVKVHGKTRKREVEVGSFSPFGTPLGQEKGGKRSMWD